MVLAIQKVAVPVVNTGVFQHLVNGNAGCGVGAAGVIRNGRGLSRCGVRRSDGIVILPRERGIGTAVCAGRVVTGRVLIVILFAAAGGEGTGQRQRRQKNGKALFHGNASFFGT